jgi:hypothetical protein
MNLVAPVIAALLTIATLQPAGERPLEVRPEQAKEHVGRICTLLMQVKSSKDEKPRKLFYLDSEKDYRDAKNLAIVISYADAQKFAKLGIKDPAAYYQGKTIRVTGKVVREEGQIQIRVTETSQIVLKENQPRQVP